MGDHVDRSILLSLGCVPSRSVLESVGTRGKQNPSLASPWDRGRVVLLRAAPVLHLQGRRDTHVRENRGMTTWHIRRHGQDTRPRCRQC